MFLGTFTLTIYLFLHYFLSTHINTNFYQRKNTIDHIYILTLYFPFNTFHTNTFNNSTWWFNFFFILITPPAIQIFTTTTTNSRCLSLSFTFRPAKVKHSDYTSLNTSINDHAHVYVHDMPHDCCNSIHVVFNHSSR